MKERTLFVSDMDGTLLNSQSELSPSTIERLNTLINDKGVLFTVATARTPATATILMKDVKSNIPYILMTGAALWDPQQSCFSNVRTMSNEAVEQILEVFAKHHVAPFVYRRHGNTLIVHHSHNMTEREKAFMEPRVQTPLKQLRLCDKIAAHDVDEAMLVFSLGPYPAMDAINKELRERGVACSPACYYDIDDSSQGILDIYAPDTNKASAIKRLANDLGATRIVVFGDNRNDLSMMSIADHSVAVANAYDEVKAQADEVIGCNDEDAVVKWIEDNCLIG